jgi:hypothetical protein
MNQPRKPFLARTEHAMADYETIERVQAETEEQARSILESHGYTVYEVWEDTEDD